MTEERQVPEAEFAVLLRPADAQGHPVEEPHLPAYLFLGELSGAAAVLGAARGGHRPAGAGPGRAARRGRRAAYGGAAFLTADLGRPERFLNMLRVAKPTSPMSMGSWILAAHSGLVSAAAASEVTGRLRRLGTAAGAGAA